MPHEAGMCDPPFEYLRAAQMLWRTVLDIHVIGYRDELGEERSDAALDGGFDDVPLPVLAYMTTCLMNYSARRHTDGFEAGLRTLLSQALGMRVDVDNARPALVDAFTEMVITSNLGRLGSELCTSMRSLSPGERADLMTALLGEYCPGCGKQRCGADGICACVGAE